MASTAKKTPKTAAKTGRNYSQTKKTAAKKPVKGKTQAKKNTSTNNGSARTALLAVAAVLLLIIETRATGNDFTDFVASLGQGLLGSAANWIVIFTLVLLAAGSFLANRVGDESAKWYVAPVLTSVNILTAIEAFHVESVMNGSGLRTYANFLKRAYEAKAGGGAMGGLLAYPLENLLKPGFTLVLLIALEIMLLHMCGLFDVGKVFGAVVNGSVETGKKVAEGISGAVVSAKASIEKARQERIYDEVIDKSKDNGGKIDLPQFGKGGKRNVTSIDPVGDVFDVPQAGRKKPRTEEIDFDFLDETPKSKKSKLTEAIEKEDPKKRNSRYMSGALSGQDSTLSNPKTPADANRDEYYSRLKKTPDILEGKKTMADAAREQAEEMNVSAKPAPEKVKQPQQPKPSFFEESKPAPEGKTIRQNSDQGKPSDTTYVKPDLGSASVSRPAEAVTRYAAPVKKEEPKKEYVFPSMDLMETGGPNSGAIRSVDDVDKDRALKLVQTLESFSINVKLTGITHGPAVTRYEILPAPGIKVSRIAGLADDIAMAMEAVSVRIEAPIPGKNAVGVEIPNVKTEVVHLRDILESPEAKRNTKKLMVAMGKDNNGRHIVADLASMPHVLIAGQTGSGKSVCINAFIISLLYRATPEEVRMIMIDPKMVELNVYNSIPHLLVPVVTDPKKASGALDWAVAEMARRYKVLAEKGAKNIESYNSHLEEGEERMPQIVIIVDELADLMMSSPREVEDAICRLAQLARAAGMHLVIATQRPSVDVITGLIKANIPTRIAFTVASGVDSKTILDTVGAEKLLGRGDMLYKPQDKNKPIRMQGAWVSEEEVDRVVEMVSASGSAEFDAEMLEHMENAAMSDAEKKDKHDEKVTHEVDDLFERAVRYCVDEGQASTSMLQRRLRVGYARAGSLIDEMEQRGYISGSNGSKSRNVLVTRQELDEIFGQDSIAD